MNSLPYIIQVQGCIAVFWLVYRLFMRGSRAFGHNRAYLLGTTVLAFVIPALSIPVWAAPAAQAVGTFDLGALQAYVVEAEQPKGIAWQDVAAWVYLAGVLLMGAGVGRHIANMARTLRRGQLVQSGPVRIVSHEAVRSPYSFFRSIFIGPAADDPGAMSRIVAHEMAHVRLGHSYDAVFAQTMLIAFWWNPFVWLWNRSLKEVHEYQADHAVLDLGFDAKHYITLLIGTLADQQPEFVSGFSYSLLKNRLLMMTKPVNSRRAGLRILAAAPAAAVLMLLFSFTEKSAAPASLEMNTKTETQTAMLQPPPADADEPFVQVQNMPRFQDGDGQAFRAWVQGQLNYPAEAAQKGIQGQVIVCFIVERDGTVSSVKATESPDASLSAEVIRIVSSSPKWTPGTQQGEAVRVSLVLPIIFRLTNDQLTQDMMIRGGRMPEGVHPADIAISGSSDGGVILRSRSGQSEVEPLIILDGERMPANFNIRVIDPDKIQSIDVLKNESAVQVYGQAGQNGVMIVTTKQSIEPIRVIGYGTQRQDSIPIRIVRIRGEQGGPDPLIIVDGEKMPADFDLTGIDSNRVQSIDVLKNEGNDIDKSPKSNLSDLASL